MTIVILADFKKTVMRTDQVEIHRKLPSKPDFNLNVTWEMTILAFTFIRMRRHAPCYIYNNKVHRYKNVYFDDTEQICLQLC